MSTGDLITRVYRGFTGVDFRGEGFVYSRSPDSLNVWKDYKETDGIRTRPGMALHTAFDEPVYGVFFFRDILLVHSGTKLYKVVNGTKTVIYSGLKAAASESFAYEDKWYFKDGKHYLQYDGTTIKAVEGYVPTTSIGRNPAGGGTTYEDVNFLSDKRINTFLADGKSVDFLLDAKSINSDFKPVVKVNDAVVSNYTVDYAAGKITFSTAPAAPSTPAAHTTQITPIAPLPKNKVNTLPTTFAPPSWKALRVNFRGNVIITLPSA